MKRVVAALTAAGVLLVAGCGGGSSATVTATVLVPVTVTVTAGQEADAATTAGAPETSSPATTAAGADSAGTRANPVPAGTPATVGDWTITFEPTVTDASEAVAAENQFNDPPAAGKQFVMAMVHATYNGAGSKRATVDLRVSFVGVGGNTFGSSMNDSCGVIPDALQDAGEVFAGATASGNECVAVASDQVAGGSWSVKAGFSSDATFFGLS